MGALKAKAMSASRSRKRSLAESVEFPRWIVAAGIGLIGFMLFLAAISDSAGKLGSPRVREYVFLGAVVVSSAGVAYIDPKRWAAGKQLFVRILRGVFSYRRFSECDGTVRIRKGSGR
jgi:hypothetical protein